jgi:hypothetical protein
MLPPDQQKHRDHRRRERVVAKFPASIADAKSALPRLGDASVAKIMDVATHAYCPQYQSKSG